jgi:hypothetical protein
MPSPEYDLRFMQAGNDLLEEYLMSGDIYWPIGVSAPHGEPDYPQFTLGRLLLVRTRAQLTAGAPVQRAEFERLDRQMEETRSRWRIAWGKKAHAEFHARLTLWRNFLEEYRKEPAANYDRYHYEVGRRVLLHLLKDEVEELPLIEIEMLAGLDTLLKAAFAPGPFIWDLNLAPAFPQETYWYLYGSLIKDWAFNR